MGKLITVVGNSGVGKTTFVKALCAVGGFTNMLEQHIERPFQQLFAQGLYRYALTNQVDYLLLRAEQELDIRRSQGTGVVDGGLEQDFHIFTHLFYKKGFLSQAEVELCKRLYFFYREILPLPDLTIWLQAPRDVITERFARRERSIQIAQVDDLRLIDDLLRDWMSTTPPNPLLILDVTTEDISYRTAIAKVLNTIRS